ncbi:hypothetical protein GUITHDRAFT_136886 [Guillardia theta CCMP2712]|uniref:SPRY domain-containing protein n=1 Tax=Guillardia theta (strain CCMP2712) TaxID=905079 RepID=L1JIS1_GUITC|nr:hypothetical protein GUITHDRAFT_136886 [Guillardia theta CCMP2712]EKX48381.1 hypothetical protein GUITHDRAFT_136886 [Guillardia theta CCMP2712]|eukprot:XP_005835361.1 hypothetical protein GUITHDRAFT_136886 [Guillardia theta CCMP2712]
MLSVLLLLSLLPLSDETRGAEPSPCSALLRLRGGGSDALKEVKSAMQSGYVSSMVFSDEDEVVSEDIVPVQVLPVGYENSSSLERDLRASKNRHEEVRSSLPSVSQSVLPGREYLAAIRREYEESDAVEAQAIRSLILDKDGYIPKALYGQESGAASKEENELSNGDFPSNSANTTKYQMPRAPTAAAQFKPEMMDSFGSHATKPRAWEPFKPSSVLPVLEELNIRLRCVSKEKIVMIAGELFEQLIRMRESVMEWEIDIRSVFHRLLHTCSLWRVKLLKQLAEAEADNCHPLIERVAAFDLVTITLNSMLRGNETRTSFESPWILDSIAKTKRSTKQRKYRSSRKEHALPGMKDLSACCWDTEVICRNASKSCYSAGGSDGSDGAPEISEGGRIVKIVGEGTVLVQEPPEQLSAERRMVFIYAQDIQSKDAFVGVVNLKACKSLGADRYLPEIGYGVRGGSSRNGRLKSTPQYLKGSRTVERDFFVSNFRTGQIICLLLDKNTKTLDYFLDGKFQGTVFSDLQVEQLRQGSSEFAVVGCFM